MSPSSKAPRSKRFLFNLLLTAIILAFCYGLMVFCEATAQQSFAVFNKFYSTGRAALVLWNSTLLLSLLTGALYLLTTKLSVSVALVSLPVIVFHVIDAFKLLFRNEPLYPWDLSLASEMTNIVGSMKITLSAPMIWTVVFFVLTLTGAILADIFWLKKRRPSYKRALLWGLCLLLLFVGAGGLLLNENYLQRHGIDTISFDQSTSYRTNGFLYSFTANLYKSKIHPPQNYNQGTMAGLVADYEATEGSVEDPNIIMVMSEAFADIWNASELHFEQEVAPNFTALSEKYLTGSTMTSEFGGNTANCEFEVLTGYSTVLFPSGNVAYMNYVNGQVDSYVSFLNRKNYYTVALHPYLRSFFSREKAYSVLGFDDFYSEEHFVGAERLRLMQYISDDAVVDRIIQEYEQNEATNQPFFCHTVTMQNHASYFEEDLPVEEQLDFTADCDLEPEEYATLRSYASGIHLADAALGKLVNYFEQVEEPTVILFFGDHQPSLYGDSRELLERIGYCGNRESANGLLALQSTPYLIWNNFEQEPTHAEETMSMFHLVPYLTRTLDLDRPAFHAYMDDLFQQVQGFTRQVVCNGDGEAEPFLAPKEQEAFDQYLTLIYDGLLGKRYANPYLYEQKGV